jgi:hypothetical protein
MKLILGATIALLALVSVGLAVYAYTEHREVAYLTLRADHLERRITQLEPGSSVAYLTLRADALEERINKLEDNTSRISQLERQVNSGAGPAPEVNSWGETTPEERRAIREKILEHGKQPPPVVYTDQQIIDSRDQGPNRPECAGVRARAMQVPTWLRAGLHDLFGCATVEDRLDELERQQKWDQGSRYP